MRREAAYLTIPPAYANRLGGLAWSPRGDAIDWVRRDGSEEGLQTFLFPSELAEFLDGVASGREGRLLHFAHALHLLTMLGLRPRPYDPEETLPPPPPSGLLRLSRIFIAEGKPLRNAGVLCGRLCRDVVSPHEVPEPSELRLWLANDGPRVAMMLRSRGQGSNQWEPVIGPDDFEHILAAAVDPIGDEELATWFRNGSGPIGDVAEQLSDGLLALKPRSLEAALAALARRDRLAGAVPIVDQLDSALALPPRRSLPQTLPTGGYADIGTRGRPEQILPSQFGLEDLEFLRRHAEHELLYFQREEPNRSTTEELVLLLDQGVRTWGKPRLALSAAALALAKHAVRRSQAVLVGGTSSLGRLFDPRLANDEALGLLWEASDLTANPAAALRAVLDEPGADGGVSARDVVLLTHPRSAIMAEVGDAARLAPAGVRVFAVAIDEAGQVGVREYRAGATLKVGDFRVRWPEPRIPAPKRPSGKTRRSAWTGDVEPVGYPFPVRWDEPPSPIQFDFDPDSRWLFAASPRGFVHVWELNSEVEETLPRAMLEDDIIDKFDMVLGVRGGFVVAGRMARSLVIAHYDLATRTVHSRILGSTWNQPWQWFYRKEDHLIIARGRDLCRGYDLATRQVYLSRGTRTRVPLRLMKAFESANNHLQPPPILKVVHDGTEQPDRGEWIDLDRKSGRVTMHGLADNWEFVTTADGRPAFRETWIEHAQRRGDVLAMVTCSTGDPARLWIVDGPTGETIREYDHQPTRLRFLLSPDGRWIVRALGSRKFDIRPLNGPPRRLSLANVPRTDGDLPRISLGPWGVFLRWNTTRTVRIHWNGGLLRWADRIGHHWSDGLDAGLAPDPWDDVSGTLQYSANGFGAAPNPSSLAYDPGRFLAATRLEHLSVVLDRNGLVIFWGRERGLIGVIDARSATAWMPDGSTWPLAGEEAKLADYQALSRHLGQALLRAESHAPALMPPPPFDPAGPQPSPLKESR